MTAPLFLILLLQIGINACVLYVLMTILKRQRQVEQAVANLILERRVEELRTREWPP